MRRCLMLVLLIALAGCGCQKLVPKQTTPIYLIIVDTLRTDALSLYGGSRPTPFLDEFAKRAVVFDNCFSASSWTVPSVASIMTGLYPFHHGTTKALQSMGKVLSQQTLSAGYLTMAEMLQEAGYRTYGISANGHIAPTYGFAQGFNEYVSHEFTPMTSVAGSWEGLRPRVLGEARFDQPVFIMLYYFDPHHPYMPQMPYIDRYFPNWMEKGVDLIAKDMVNLYQEGFFDKRKDMIELARALYDSEVAALDAHFAKLIPELPNLDNAMVIVTADHGESFGEEGKMLHGNNLRQTEVHVPLLIKMPKDAMAGTRISTPVSLVDLLPTLAEAANHVLPSNGDGVSLMPLLTGSTIAERPLYLHIDLPWARQRAMVAWPFKIIRGDGEEKFVYDLLDDPREETNIADTHEQELKEWLRSIAKKAADNVRFPPRVVTGEIPAELKDKLRNLGYLN